MGYNWDMQDSLSEIIMVYATRPHKELNGLLVEKKSKDNLIAALNDLITVYMNDANSSALREYVTVIVAKYEHLPQKLGYNGFKQSTKVGGQPLYCEVKPKNINTERNEKRAQPTKHDGGGSFNDYTYARLEKDVQANLNILTSGFIDGKLIFVLEFSFGCLKSELKRQLDNHFHGSSQKGNYLRGATFTFKHYRDCNKLKIIYVDQKTLSQNKKLFTKDLFNFLSDVKVSKKTRKK